MCAPYHKGVTLLPTGSLKGYHTERGLHGPATFTSNRTFGYIDPELNKRLSHSLRQFVQQFDKGAEISCIFGENGNIVGPGVIKLKSLTSDFSYIGPLIYSPEKGIIPSGDGLLAGPKKLDRVRADENGIWTMVKKDEKNFGDRVESYEVPGYDSQARSKEVETLRNILLEIKLDDSRKKTLVAMLPKALGNAAGHIFSSSEEAFKEQFINIIGGLPLEDFRVFLSYFLKVMPETYGHSHSIILMARDQGIKDDRQDEQLKDVDWEFSEPGVKAKATELYSMLLRSLFCTREHITKFSTPLNFADTHQKRINSAFTYTQVYQGISMRSLLNCQCTL
jgi:hypothetical protein